MCRKLELRAYAELDCFDSACHELVKSQRSPFDTAFSRETCPSTSDPNVRLSATNARPPVLLPHDLSPHGSASLSKTRFAFDGFAGSRFTQTAVSSAHLHKQETNKSVLIASKNHLKNVANPRCLSVPFAEAHTIRLTSHLTPRLMQMV
jgi:hypothetical protein